ncbi:uncharacterized protein TNCV_4380381 [Trichonephila clavipes]|nr:uncharacterized protein TNCV_4380381 [Trichonephila clavipes]
MTYLGPRRLGTTTGLQNCVQYNSIIINDGEKVLVIQIHQVPISSRQVKSYYGVIECNLVISGKREKADLIKLAIELGECESIGEELKIIEVRTKILTNNAYKEDPEFVKCIFEGVVSSRIDEENKQKEKTLHEFELQKIRLQNDTQRVIGPQTLPPTKIELKKLLPTFNPEVDNIDLFLALFEQQMKLLDLGEDLWIPYLIGALPSDVTSLIARKPEEK